MNKKLLKLTSFLLMAALLGGCTFVLRKGRRSDLDTITRLERENKELASAKEALEESLMGEIKSKQVQLEMKEKGLVITFVADVLFDSGKAKLRSESLEMLDKVAFVLNKNVRKYNVGIEGHTDNQPIKHSGWKSNWELSTARALSVLHHLINKERVSAKRLSAIGYGEFNPVASNMTKEGCQLNRRVEIVVLPKFVKERSQNSSKEENIK